MYRVAFIGILLAVVAQLAYLYGRTLQASVLPEVPPPFTCPPLDESAALGRFRRLLTFPTVSNASAPDHVSDPQAFRALLAALAESYPTVWSKLTVEEMGSGGFSRLITWPGSDASLLPVLFVSHLDVVPVTPGTEAEWAHPPWGGELADGFVWGRGSADIKFSVAALLQAAEGALAAGWTPARTIMFAFGHDEELGGPLGAGAIASLLASRGVELEVVVDEGGVVLLDGLRPFTAGPLALVGTAEKGFSTLSVTLRSAGGHSSMPPTDGSDVASQLARLTLALRLLPPGPPGRSGLAPPVTHMLAGVAPHAPGWVRPLLASSAAGESWLVNRLLAFAFRHLLSRETAALVSNTLALTVMRAGVAHNVLPQEAHLTYNARLLPGSSAADALDRLKRAARWARVDAEVAVVEGEGWMPSNVTSPGGRHFALLRRAIQETWREEGQPAVAVVPFLLTGGTDSKHYARLSRGGILRFVPYGLNKSAGELGLLHATNERIRAAHLPRAVCAYTRMFQLLAGAPEGQR